MSVFVAGAGTPSGPINYLNYIQSTGTQYINTGVKGSSNIKIQIKFEMTEETGYTIIGYYVSEAECFRLFNPSQRCYLDFGNSFSNRIYEYGESLPINQLLEIEFGNFYVKNLQTGSNIISGSAVSSFFQNQNICICGNQQFSKGKFYYVKIYDGSNLIKDYIPCLDKNGVACMYDKVSKQYAYNSGTGEFIGG